MFVAAAFFSVVMQLNIINKPLPEYSRNDLRDSTKNYIVLHNDGSNNDMSSTYQTLRKRRLGYHYFISRAGKIYQFIDPKYAASHAGTSSYDGLYKWNKFSISICLQGTSIMKYSHSQYKSLKTLLDILYLQYPDSKNLPLLGHSDIAYPRGRKDDPGSLFDITLLYLTEPFYDPTLFPRRSPPAT